MSRPLPARGREHRAAPPGRVRIIAGRWRGTRIAVPEGASVRPTPDRVRETLFNWLAPVIDGAACLDLYAGTGVLGLEALSRGAGRATFVERDRRLAGALSERVGLLAAPAQVVCADVQRWLEGTAEGSYDIVFVDPPYDRPLASVLAALPRVLAPGALAYVERPARPGLPAAEGWVWHRQGRAGEVAYGLAARAEEGR